MSLPPFFLNLSLVFRWGHFSTVWLVKDSQSVEIFFQILLLSYLSAHLLDF